MKKLLFILLFVPVLLFGQTSVPNTETFSLQDVYNAVHAHTGGTATSLQSCFDNAISSYFNPTYNQDSYAPANSMLRFRDYKPSSTCDYPLVSFVDSVDKTCPPPGGLTTYTITSEATAITACAQWYSDPSCLKVSYGFTARGASGYTVGTQLYSQSSPCNAITTTGWYLYFTDDLSTAYVIHLTNGVIDSSSQCHP